MRHSENDIHKICTDAKIEKGLAIHGTEAINSQSVLENWIKKLEEGK